MDVSSSNSPASLAAQARSLFVERALGLLPGLAALLEQTLVNMAAQSGNARTLQEAHDALLDYQKNSGAWVRRTLTAWRQGAAPVASGAPDTRTTQLSGKLELLGDTAVEHRILASRLALRLLDFSSWELNDLRLRIQSLQGVTELHKQDIFRPEVLAHHLVEQWTQAPLSPSVWRLLQDVIHKTLAQQMQEAYHATNEFLIHHGVMVEIDLRALVRRTPSAGVQAPLDSSVSLDSPRPKIEAAPFDPTLAAPLSARGEAGRSYAQPSHRASEQPSLPPSHYAAPDELRQPAAAGLASPLARLRARAQGVMGRLRQMLSSQAPGFESMHAQPASPQLAQTMVRLQQEAAVSELDLPSLFEPGQAQPGPLSEQARINQALGQLRQRTSTLKQAASTSAEKATIEIVALMFQSILAEDRIPPGMRVWFARLQMPVLRVAIAEPGFFNSLQHPARQLIDRMGSCVLGFDVTVANSLLEAEVKRIVQVIEQYPETGRRVFELVYAEFDTFLSRFLAEQGNVSRVASVAQQLEQKETMVIQYTIEMRTMLNDMPMREEIRDFLFRTWAEVLALAATKNGPQHTQTLLFKQAAADLVWAASAKPNRNDRTRVIGALPGLLQLLRQGMAMLGLELPAQDAQIKIITGTLADAFMSRTDVIAQEKVEAMARRLRDLEDYLSDENLADLKLDADNLVMMIGLDEAQIEVLADTEKGPPAETMRAWAAALQPGSWFVLDHNGKVSHVQLAWCSERKQLHLFAAADGRNFLIQLGRLASYLQAGLLRPLEEEALTVRATRDALAKLDANPERLLN
ncbi:MAG: DUF1631 family protein [Polaromonas sp.]